MIRKHRIIALCLTMVMLAVMMMPAAVSQAAATGVFIRANQLGYKPGASKTAIALSSAAQSGSFYIRNAGGTVVYTGTVGADKGAWGNYSNSTYGITGANMAHSYLLDFSAFQTVGTGYTLALGSYTSPAFAIGNNVYDSLTNLSMQFFKVQRCGNTSPLSHGVCHVTGTGSSADGKADGASSAMDASGGWHDAADYIKFMSTIGYVTDVMLASYINRPNAFPNPATEVIAESRVGLDFIKKMWNNSTQTLYMEVADGLDHDVDNADLDSRSKCWPENDNTIYGTYRPVHPCPAGKGANIAGKAAAALALGYIVYNDASKSWYNASLASSYLTAAQQIYTWGSASGRAAVAYDADEYYVDTDYKDDLAWAAAELYRATGTASYLTAARSYCDSAGAYANVTLNWSRSYEWANYEIAKLDSSYKTTATGRMNSHLSAQNTYANAQVWANGSAPGWGSLECMANVGLEALMYQELTGNTTYAAFAQRQMDFALGRNPWGVSMINGAGSTYYQNPRHRVTTLQRANGNPGYQLSGAWSAGFETSTQWASDQADPLLASQIDLSKCQFNDNRMIWFDNRRDYATNEVTITGNIAGVAFTAFMGDFTTTPGGTVTSTPTADAYVRSGTYATQNFGTATTLDIKDDPATDNYLRQGYLKFNVTGLTSVTGAKLRLYGSAAASATVKVLAVADDSWSETGITYNSKPVAGALQSTKTVGTTAQYYEFDVTPFIQSEVSSGASTFSFAVTGDALQDISVSFNSKENTASKPQLVITR